MDIKQGILIGETEDGETATLPVVELVLSERNLRSLLLNLDNEENAVTRYTEVGVLFVIRGETNEVHYKDRAAGLMDDETEAKLLQDEFDTDEPLVVPPNFGEKLH